MTLNDLETCSKPGDLLISRKDTLYITNKELINGHIFLSIIVFRKRVKHNRFKTFRFEVIRDDCEWLNYYVLISIEQ